MTGPRQGNPRLLILRPGALGDTVLTEPVVASIRSRWPGARIELAGRMDYLPLLVGPGSADAAASMDSAAFASLFSERPVELPHFDLVVAFLPDSDGALRAKLTAWCGAAAVHDPRPGGAAAHVVDHLLAALEPLGVPVVRRRPHLACREEWSAEAGALLRRLGIAGPYAVIHPGSGGRAKLWEAGKWADVVERLAPMPVVLTAGPADEGVVERIVAAVGVRAAVVRDQPVTTLAGVLARARIYAGCDSGVTHLAAALGVPTVAVFGPTDPRVWGPRGRRLCVLAGKDGRTESVTASMALDAMNRMLPV